VLTGRDIGDPGPGIEHSEATAWSAWVLFAAGLLAVAGAVEAVLGLVIVLDPDAVAGRVPLVPVGDGMLGWIHLGLGGLAVATGIGLILGRRWARVVGIVLALAGMTVNLALVAAFPALGLLASAFYVLTVYAVAVHGGELAAARGRPWRPGRR